MEMFIIGSFMGAIFGVIIASLMVMGRDDNGLDR